jgi:hypothetical protein
MGGARGGWAALALWVALTACSVTRPEGSDAYPSLDLATDTQGLADLGGGAGSATDLEGVWYLRSETANCVNASGAVLETVNRNWYRVSLRHLEYPLGPGVEAMYEATLLQCRVDLTPVILNITPSVTYGMLDAQGSEVFHFIQTTVGGKTLLTSTTMVEQWGVELADPVSEALPISAEDPRVVDEDGDGSPGITMTLGDGFCEMHMVQRTVNLYAGEAQGFSLLQGTLTSDVSKNILGGTKPLCLTKNILAPNPARNHFMMIRADGNGDYPLFDGDGDGQPTCLDLRVDALADAVKAQAGFEDLTKDHANCKGIEFPK